MNRIIIVFGVVSMLLGTGLSAQTIEKCGTMHNYKQLETNNLSLKQHHSDVEQIAQDWLSNNPNFKKTVANLPVVFHVVYNPCIPEQNVLDLIIYSQLEVLNNDYRRMNADTVNTRPEFDSLATDVGIEFCMANVDPSGNFTTGINRVKTQRMISLFHRLTMQ